MCLLNIHPITIDEEPFLCCGVTFQMPLNKSSRLTYSLTKFLFQVHIDQMKMYPHSKWEPLCCTGSHLLQAIESIVKKIRKYILKWSKWEVICVKQEVPTFECRFTVWKCAKRRENIAGELQYQLINGQTYIFGSRGHNFLTFKLTWSCCMKEI